MLVSKARQRARGGGDNLSLAMVRVDNLESLIAALSAPNCRRGQRQRRGHLAFTRALRVAALYRLAMRLRRRVPGFKAGFALFRRRARRSASEIV